MNIQLHKYLHHIQIIHTRIKDLCQQINKINSRDYLYQDSLIRLNKLNQELISNKNMLFDMKNLFEIKNQNIEEIKNMLKSYELLIDNYELENIFNLNKDKFKQNDTKHNLKLTHRLNCINYNLILKNIILPEFGDKTNIKETILIEFRPLVVVEFLLRNTILKLHDWNHTVVCGNNNYLLFKKITDLLCNHLVSKIKVIRLDIDNLLPSDYSKLLTTKEFWSQFVGEKLLIYQDDTFLFHNKIEHFLEYDYIGAPWPENQDDNSIGVGNGGFSLRSKSKLLECLNKIKPLELKLNNSTLTYINNTNSTYPPEDVYFSKTMLDFNIGKVAPRNKALQFSQETCLSNNPLGGHCFWYADIQSIKKPYIKNLVLNNSYYLEGNHRYGWKNVINQSIKNNVLNISVNNRFNNNILLIDNPEYYFRNNYHLPKNTKWYGIIHYCANLPSYFQNNKETAYEVIMYLSKYFKECLGIITLSIFLKNDLKKFLKSIGIHNIPIYSIKHPIDEIPIKFNLDKFINNTNYNVILLGQQYIKVTSIYTIKTQYPKIWLSGIKNKDKLNKIIIKEGEYLNLDISKFNKDVKCIFTNTDQEFDDLIMNNIIIISLFDASANNSLLECMEMNIPAFITRLPACEEYLGKDYPMFFNKLEEIESIINNKDLLHDVYTETYNYLCNLNKDSIRYTHFNSELLKIVNNLY